MNRGVTSTLLVTLKTDAMVNSLNQSGLCGTFVKDVPKDILTSPDTCTFKQGSPAAYSIYKVSGTTLYIGVSSDGRDGQTSDTRYNTYDSITYTKQ